MQEGQISTHHGELMNHLQKDSLQSTRKIIVIFAVVANFFITSTGISIEHGSSVITSIVYVSFRHHFLWHIN